MLSYKTPAAIKRENEDAKAIIAGRGQAHVPDTKRRGASGESIEDVRRRVGDKTKA